MSQNRTDPPSTPPSPFKPPPFGPAGDPQRSDLFGAYGPPPGELLWLLGLLIATFALRRLAFTTSIVEPLRLSDRVFRSGFVWQVVTYPFIGSGISSFFFLVELLALFLLARVVYAKLGRRRAWETVLFATVGAGLVASLALLLFPGRRWTVLELVQGQRVLIIVLVTTVAVLHRDVVLFRGSILPLKASWLIGLVLLLAFFSALSFRDFAGFVGVCAAVLLTLRSLTDIDTQQRLRWASEALAGLARCRMPSRGSG